MDAPETETTRQHVQKVIDSSENTDNTEMKTNENRELGASKAELITANSEEDNVEKYPYPKSVIFILGNEVCERFCYYGLRAILALYLKNVLLYGGHEATAIIHFFVLLCYFFPLVGAILSDSFIGKFWTILYLSIVYTIGTVVLALGSVETMGLPQRELTWVGLILIAVGTGGIKPCVSAFGGDQFKMPQQAKQLAQFFSLFYFSINLGSCTSMAVTPLLRKLQCLGSESCYPVSFGLPAILMIVATVLFVLGKPLYVMRKPDGNVLMDVMKCILHAIKMKKQNKSEKKKHWLDCASDKFDEKLISNVKALLDVAIIFIPAPLFWAVFDQQSSTWIFQAEKMNGKIGGWTLLPEQVQVINPILILVFVPLFEFWIYPMLAKCHLLTTPLQKFGFGLILGAVSFAMSAGLEYLIEAGEPNSINILWQMPQVVVMTVAEVLFSVQGLNFGFTQAPVELKAVVTSLWLLTTAFGNLIIVLISGSSLFSYMVYEYLFYAFLILLDFALFVVLAMRYKYKDFTT